MKTLVMLSLALATAGGSVGRAEERVPRYADYPAAIYTGPAAPVQLDTDLKRAMMTRLRKGSQAPPNFAGSYRIVTWGSGTNTQNGLVVDRRTGKVYEFPEDPADLELFNLQHRANSRLIVMTNRAYTLSIDCNRPPRRFFLVFDQGKFRLVKTIEWPDKRWAEPFFTPPPKQDLVDVKAAETPNWCPAKS